MMVPEMQAVLVRAVASVDGNVTSVYDPFAGSGTTLVECMRLGLDFAGTGHQSSCRALLPHQVGTVPHAPTVERFAGRGEPGGSGPGQKIRGQLPGLRKWFDVRAIDELSRIRRAIRRVDHTWCRRVLWTALAETVRRTSNSRTSTFKLHVRCRDDLESRCVYPVKTFEAVGSDISERLHEEAGALRDAGHLSKNGYYRGEVSIRLGDSRVLNAERARTT